MALSQETIDAVIDAIATSGNTSRALRETGTDRKEFYALLNADETVRNRYARAKELGLDAFADEMLEIAAEPRRGVKVTTKADGTTETVEGDTVDRSRLDVDTRKWWLARMAPKKYGDKLDVNATGSMNVTVTATENRL